MFVVYLWGIETNLIFFIFNNGARFVVYLWGIETKFRHNRAVTEQPVCSLPMRDWNSFIVLAFSSTFSVCSLPMRDWNHVARPGRSETYCVCSLPMRDWNDPSPQLGQFYIVPFVVYLWGIETKYVDAKISYVWIVCSLPMRDWNTVEGTIVPQPIMVCSLPMRDWNWKIQILTLTGNWVCSLPMRDWNTVSLKRPYIPRPCL